MNPLLPQSEPVERMLAEAVGWHQQGQLGRAQALYQQILAVQPQHAQALHLLGVAAGQVGRFREAVDLIGRAVELDSRNGPAHSNLGNALRELGQYPQALSAHDQAIALDPGMAQAHNGRGVALHRLKRHDEALESLEQAIALVPGYVEARVNRGLIFLAMSRDEDALASFDGAIRMEPRLASAHQNRGVALMRLNRFAQALDSFDQALALAPHGAEGHLGRADALRKLRRTAEAVECYDQAIALRPDDAPSHFTRGTALQELGESQEAQASYDAAILLQSDYVDAHFNKGTLFQACGQPGEALRRYDRVIAIQPDHAGAHWNRCLCHLSLGNYAAGWPGYEWRDRVEGTSASRNRRAFAQPLWNGAQPLQGKTILLHGEQGYGDALQFCRFATSLARSGARVLMEIPAALAELTRSVEGVDQVIVKGCELPPFDFHCPMMSLPAALGTTLATLPAPPAYLRVDGARMARWRTGLISGSQPRVGLAWSGNPAHANDMARSIPLAKLTDLLVPGLDFFSLQKDVREADRAALRQIRDIRQFGQVLDDFSDTAALIEQMDLVISVDTSVAHLAGALGKPVWMLLPHVPDWRWLLDREDSPWYPSARLFRQSRPGDWAGVIQQVRAALGPMAR